MFVVIFRWSRFVELIKMLWFLSTYIARHGWRGLSGGKPVIVRWSPMLAQEFLRAFPVYKRVAWRVGNAKYWTVAFSRLTWQWIRKGECYIYITGYCCDTGRHGDEYTYPNPWRAVKSMHYHQTENWCDGPGFSHVSDGVSSSYHEAPDGWDALAADREYEEEERHERYLRGLGGRL